MTDKIRAKARELLESGQVSCFIGYEEGTRGRVRPAFAYEPGDTDRLIWDERCTYNLSTYLHQFRHPLRRGEEPPRVGILVKPCDSRTLNVLIHEEQIDRERIYVVGVTCKGVQVNGQTEERCQRCAERVPLVYDVVMGRVPKVVGREDACRQACPACYCFECVAEQLDPQWMSIGIDLSQKRFFHVMRAYHLAGRCSGCSACEEACPMGIPLSLLNRKIAKEVEDLFGYRPGQDAATPPPLATFMKEEELPM